MAVDGKVVDAESIEDVEIEGATFAVTGAVAFGACSDADSVGNSTGGSSDCIAALF